MRLDPPAVPSLSSQQLSMQRYRMIRLFSRSALALALALAFVGLMVRAVRLR